MSPIGSKPGDGGPFHTGIYQKGDLIAQTQRLKVVSVFFIITFLLEHDISAMILCAVNIFHNVPLPV